MLNTYMNASQQSRHPQVSVKRAEEVPVYCTCRMLELPGFQAKCSVGLYHDLRSCFQKKLRVNHCPWYCHSYVIIIYHSDKITLCHKVWSFLWGYLWACVLLYHTQLPRGIITMSLVVACATEIHHQSWGGTKLYSASEWSTAVPSIGPAYYLAASF